METTTELMEQARLKLKSLKVLAEYNLQCVNEFLKNCHELNVPLKHLHRHYKRRPSDIWLVITDAYSDKTEYDGKYFFNHHIVYEKIISNDILLNICVMTNYFVKDNYEPVVLLSVSYKYNFYCLYFRKKNHSHVKDKIPKFVDVILDVQLDDSIDKILLVAEKELKKISIDINKYNPSH